VSVTLRYCIKTFERIQIIFGTEASLGLCCTVFVGNSSIFKTQGSFLWEYSATLDLEISTRHVQRRKSNTNYSNRRRPVVYTAGETDNGWTWPRDVNRRLLNTLSVQLCTQRGGRLGVTEIVARIRRHQVKLVGLSITNRRRLPDCHAVVDW